MRLYPIFLMLLSAAALMPAARADDFCVGRGSFATHTTLSEAVAAAAANGAGLDTIRLDTITFAVPDNLLIQGHAVDIIGGFEFCMPLAPTGTSTINGSSGQAASVITFLNGDGVSRTSSLDRVTVTGGSGNANGGGIVASGNGLTLLLGNSAVIAENTSFNGGGVAVMDGAALQLRGAVVRNNSASSQGGGVYCINASVDADAATSISSNLAPNGGGLSLRSGCEAHFVGGSGLSVAANTATGNGGGILAGDHSNITVSRAEGAGSPVGRGGAFQVRLNGASLRGAGIALISGATLTASGIIIADNIITASAGSSDNPFGAGLYAGPSSAVTIRPDPRCPRGEACNLFRGNLINNASVLPSAGAAIAALQSQLVDIGHLEFSGNSIGSGASSASTIFIKDSTAFLLERALFHHNGPLLNASADGLIGLDNVSSTRLHYVTVTDNVINNTVAARVIRANLLGTLALRSSIFDQPGIPLLSPVPGTSAVYDCILGNEIASLAASTRSTAGTPGFFNRAQRDYRPTLGSFQIDYCDGPPAAIPGATLLDLNLQASPQDTLTVDVHGSYDLGAYELQELFFGNGFE